MRRLLLILLVVGLALALAASVSAECGWKCGATQVTVLPGARGNACGSYIQGTRTIYPCPTPTPTP